MLTVVILLAGEPLVRSVRNPYSEKHEYVMRHGSEVKTLILGSSLTYYGIVADSLPSAFNMANVSQTYEYDCRLLERYIDSMPALERIILPVYYFSFFDPDTDPGSGGRYYKIYMDIDKYSDFSLQNLELTYFPSYSGKLKNLVTGSKGPQASLKGFGLDFTDNSRRKDFTIYSRRQAEGSYQIHDGHEAYNRQWLERLLNLAKLRGIEVILIYPPMHRDYLAGCHADQLTRTRQITQWYVKKYGLSFHDFMLDPDFTIDDFRDGSHLDRSGAEKLTRKMRDILAR